MTSLPTDATYYFYRGRVALYALLRSLKIEAGDEILIPAFTCIAVPSPILGLRAKPVYVDIDPGTYNINVADLEQKITPRSRAIVAQHTFGIPCDMDPIMKIARRHELAVIEDTCHVWGGRYNGRELGSIGAAAFYSYDPGKPFIIGMGGAAVVNSPNLNAEMHKLYADFQNPAAVDTMRLHVQYIAHRLTRHPRLFWRVRDLYRLLSRQGVAIATWTSDTLEGTLGPDYQKRLAPSLKARLCAMIREGDGVVARHRSLACLYEKGLQEVGISTLAVERKSEPVLICYPFQVNGKQTLLSAARRARVELGDWFSSPVHPLSEPEWTAVAYEKGSCPHAESVSKRVVTLPCHAGVTKREVRRTVAFLSRMQAQGLVGNEMLPRRATTQELVAESIGQNGPIA